MSGPPIGDRGCDDAEAIRERHRPRHQPPARTGGPKWLTRDPHSPLSSSVRRVLRCQSLMSPVGLCRLLFKGTRCSYFRVCGT